MAASDLLDADVRCGTRWLSHLDAAGRTALLAPLLSRFNHDLRTPLNTILGWTHLLQKGGLDEARAKHIAAVIARNSRDQTQLLEDFIDDGRAILQNLQLQMSSVAIDESVGQAIERLQGVLALHGVQLQQRLAAAGWSVRGDARRLERLVYRLLFVIVQRARESAVALVDTDVVHGFWTMSVSTSAYESDWPDASLLDLRISTLAAELHDGQLVVGGDAANPCIQLKLPCG